LNAFQAKIDDIHKRARLVAERDKLQGKRSLKTLRQEALERKAKHRNTARRGVFRREQLEAIHRNARDLLAAADSPFSNKSTHKSERIDDEGDLFHEARWRQRKTELVLMEEEKKRSIWDSFEDEPEPWYSKWWLNRCMRCVFFGSCIMVVLIALAALMRTGIIQRDTLSTKTAGVDWRQSPEASLGAQYTQLVDELAPLFPEGQQDIPTSKAQEDALLWLANEDLHQDKLTPPQLLERFVLKLLHNTTDGTTWANPKYFLTSNPTCEWGDGRLVQVQCNAQTQLLETLLIETQGLSLHGSIPTELGLLTALTTLAITSSRRMTGAIPTELGWLSNLVLLDLSRNGKLSESVPTTIGELAELRYLYLGERYALGSCLKSIDFVMTSSCFGCAVGSFLDDNALEGSIPTELAKLSNLEQLWLQNNEFVGTFPQSLLELPYIEDIRVERNALHDCPGNETIVTC
jgi:hypothetical protein